MPVGGKCWAFRLDYRPDVDGERPLLLQALRNWLTKNKSLWSLTVLEDVAGANHHVQGMCLFPASGVKDAALRARLKKCVPARLAKDRAAYSLKILKPDEDPNHPFLEMERYLCKGKARDDLPDIVSELSTTANYPDDRVAKLHREYWDANDALKKKRKMRVFDSVLSKCKSQRVERREDIARVVIRELADQDKVISINSVRSVTNLVYYKVSPDPASAMSVLLELVMEKN